MKKSLLTTTFLAFFAFPFRPANPEQSFASGFSRLTDITNCGDDRLFVVERDGRIRIIKLMEQSRLPRFWTSIHG
ncbi:MAG: hypothetical protein R2825_18830 [Saprospiraceae bacterium]